MENLLAKKKKKLTKNQWSLGRREKLALPQKAAPETPTGSSDSLCLQGRDLEKGQAHTIPGRASGTGGGG